MRLGYFTMPMHPLHRHWAETLDEDREAVILADKLGFYDAFIGEHLTDEARTRMQSWRDNTPRDKHGTHSYEARDFGIDPARLKEQFRFYSERFNLTPAVAAGA